jgi:uncharacterized protein with PQ loop repeat
MIIDLIGTIGAACLAASGIPQARKSIKDGHSNGVSHGLIWLWLIGEACVFLYVLFTSFDLLLLFNYLSNFLIVSVVAFYKYKNKKNKTHE